MGFKCHLKRIGFWLTLSSVIKLVPVFQKDTITDFFFPPGRGRSNWRSGAANTPQNEVPPPETFSAENSDTTAMDFYSQGLPEPTMDVNVIRKKNLINIFILIDNSATINTTTTNSNK